MNFLAELVVININILELSVELCVTFSSKLNCLYIVTIYYMFLFSIKVDFFKESLPLN